MVAGRPTFHEPALLAKQASNIDHISGGRLSLNVVSSWWAEEAAQYGVQFDQHDARYARTEEWLSVVDGLWREPQFSFSGRVIVLCTDIADALATVDEVIHPGLEIGRRLGARASVEAFFEPLVPGERELWGGQQGYIPLGYLLLAAEERGYHTSPMLGFDAELVKAALNLPSHVRIPAPGGDRSRQ